MLSSSRFLQKQLHSNNTSWLVKFANASKSPSIAPVFVFLASDAASYVTGQVLGDIFLGKITKWSDPAIKALNPSLNLPDAAIAPVRRADGSGTTFIFTNYLSKVNPEWKAKVGEGTAVNWPTGAGGKGNEGVAAFVGRLPNSIGYVEYAYVKQNKMAYTLMQNAAGKFVSPDDTAFKAAAAGLLPSTRLIFTSGVPAVPGVSHAVPSSCVTLAGRLPLTSAAASVAGTLPPLA